MIYSYRFPQHRIPLGIIRGVAIPDYDEIQTKRGEADHSVPATTIPSSNSIYTPDGVLHQQQEETKARKFKENRVDGISCDPSLFNRKAKLRLSHQDQMCFLPRAPYLCRNCGGIQLERLVASVETLDNKNDDDDTSKPTCD